MNNFILGSGLIARIAKDIFPNYKFIPFGKSRFYNFKIPLAENYIVANDNVCEYIKKYKSSNDILPHVREYKRPFSLAGDLHYNAALTLECYLKKVYGDIDFIASQILCKTSFNVYSNITPSLIYIKLGEEQNNSILKDLDTYSELISIDSDKRILNTKSGTYEYNHIISTIPLNILYKYLGLHAELESKKSYISLIQTNTFDFESADELLIADDFPIYNITRLFDNIYMIKSMGEMSEITLRSLIYDCKIISMTQVPDYIPMNTPNLKWLNEFNIKPVGSLARWDDFYDVSTSINSLINF